MRIATGLLAATLLAACATTAPQGASIVEADAGQPAVQAASSDIFIPIRRVPPQYPVAAARNGVAAACTLSLDIQPDGVPTNVCASCAAADDATSFERAAVRAVERWRYEPDANLWTGVTTVLNFELPSSQAPAAPQAPVCEG